jgi:hypothetical protein
MGSRRRPRLHGEGDATWLEHSFSVAVTAAQSAVLYSIGMRKQTASRCIESGEWVVDGAVLISSVRSSGSEHTSLTERIERCGKGERQRGSLLSPLVLFCSAWTLIDFGSFGLHKNRIKAVVVRTIP